METNINLQLGDIIELVSSSNEELDKKIFLIKYIDNEKIILVNNKEQTTLNIKPTGELYEESIESINILSRADTPSFAEQNNYIPGTWISIYFKGTFPIIINGIINNLENDMIEIKTYPNNDIIYIDFEYKGVPEYLNIEKIKIIDEKDILYSISKDKTSKDNQDDMKDYMKDDMRDEMQDLIKGDTQDDMQQNDNDQYNYKEHLKQVILDSNEIEIGNNLDDIIQEIKVDDDQIRYSINKQLDDLLDNILSNIPNINRNETIMNSINLEIERFRQLREKYSNFNNNNSIKDIKFLSQKYPLSDNIKNLHFNIDWIVPVITNIKYIYDTDSDSNYYIEDTTMLELLTKISVLNDQWKSNEITNDENKYKMYIKQLYQLFEPYLSNSNVNQYILNQSVNNNFDVIIDNTDNLENYGINNNLLTVKKYDYATLNTSPKILKTEYDINATLRYQINVQNNDIMHLKSLITLPNNYINYSRINCPYTNILSKTDLHENIKYRYKTLNKNKFVNSYIINNTNMEDNNIYSQDIYSNHIRHFIPEINKVNNTEFFNSDTNNDITDLNSNTSNDIADTDIDMENINGDIYKNVDDNGNIIEKIANKKLINNFLLKSFPSNQDILKKLYEETVNLYSISSIIDVSQPYLIDTENINKYDLELINKILYFNIKDYKNTIKKYSTKLLKQKTASSRIDNSLLFNIIETINKDEFLEFYKIVINNHSNSEILSAILSKDDGLLFLNFFNNSITEIIISDLLTKLNKQFQSNQSNDSKEIEKIKDNSIEDTLSSQSGESGESKKILIKDSSNDTDNGDNGDNGDDTDNGDDGDDGDIIVKDKCNKYVLSKKYLELDELMQDNDNEIFFDKQFDKTPYNMIDEYIEEKKSMSYDDFYKFIYEKLQKNMGFDQGLAKRNAKSIIDKKKVVMDGDYALLESSDQIYIRKDNKWILDKNLSSNKFFKSNKMFCNIQKNCINIDDNCVDKNKAKNILNKTNINNILNNFDSKYETSIDNIRENLIISLNNSKIYLKNLLKLIDYERIFYNRIFYKIGLQLSDINYISSPYENIRDKILELKDFPKRQLYIIKFVKFFTRSPYDSENINWLYCIKTNNKLLPNFIFKLAKCYINREDYQIELDMICANQGTISDDGNNWVDKHSGYIIKNIEFDNEEGYDDKGYKLQTREIIEKDYSINILNIPNIPNKKDEIDEKTIYGKAMSIINAITEFASIDLTNYKEFIINNVIEVNKKNLPSKETYEKLLKKSTDKKMVTYNDALNINIITITLVYILVAIQTSIPNITTKRTFPGCIKSFSGYPFETNIDKTGLIYIACIANKIKSNINPWSSIIKFNERIIIKKMEIIIEKYLINNNEFKKLVKNKADYLLINPSNITDKDVDINSWISFLPPLNQFEININKLQPIEKINNFIITNIKKNRSIVVKNLLYSKIKFMTLDIYNNIEQIVKKNKPILSNNSGDPFLENSCCDSKNNNTINYFIENDTSILQSLNIISIYSAELDRIKNLGKTISLYYPFSTKIKKAIFNSAYSEQTIYNGFIYYCKYFYNNETDELIKNLCGEPIKNIDYSKNIDELINIYKNEGKIYNLYDFENLLLQISKKNIFNINLNKERESNYNIITKLLKLDLYKNIFEEEFVELLNNILDTRGLDSNTESKRDFKNYLAREIKNMKLLISIFLNKNSKMTKRELQKITLYFDKIISFDSELKRDEDITYWCDYLKNLLNDFLIIFPTLIINKIDTKNTKNVEHWELSTTHNQDINYFINQYYEKLMKFHDNEFLKQILIYQIDKFKPIKIFINYLKYNSTNNIFDKTIILNILVYLFMYTIHDYLHILDNELIKYEIFKDEDIDIDLDIDTELSNYIINILEMQIININAIDYNNKKILDKITKSKEIEKDIITDRLKDMNDEEREIANIFKNNKLGDWNIGLQKGLTQYVKENYDSEREKLEQYAINDKMLGDRGIVTEMNKEIFKLEQEYDERLQDEIDKDNYDMGIIPDDDDFDPENVGEFDDYYANY